MRPMNPPGDPRSYHKWSVWRPMDSLGFAENVLEWKWRDDSTVALISNVHCALVKCGPRLVHFYHFWLAAWSQQIIDWWTIVPRTETDHPTINHRWSVRRARILHFLQHWINAGILLIGSLGKNFSKMWIKIQRFSFKKMHLKILSAKMAAILSRPQRVISLLGKCGCNYQL